MPLPIARRSRPALIRGLVVATVLFVVFVLAGAVALIAGERERSLANDAQQLRNLALVLSQETDRAFFALETVQSGIAEQVTSEGATTPAEFAARLNGYKTFEMLRDRAAGLPYVDAVTLIGNTGQLINFSRYWPIPTVNVADRDYFQALASDPSLRRFVGSPVHNRGSGTWNLYLARAVPNADGALIGLVLGAVRLAYVSDFYNSIDDGDSGVISLVRNDGVLLVSAPDTGGEIGRSYAGPALTTLLTGAPGVTLEQQVSPFDGVPRLLASRRLEHYPISVVVSDSMAAINRHWYRGAAVIGIAAVLTSLIGILCAVLFGRQMRIQRRYADRADWIARHDSLTGLPNRLQFHERAVALLGRDGDGDGDSRMPILLLIDLDYFKAVNDTLGHPIGDMLLQAIAKDLQALAGGERLVARLGGDEFAVLDRVDNWPDDAVRLGDRIIEMVSRTYVLGGNQVSANASIGIASGDLASGHVDQLLSHADLALYQAKGNGRGTSRLFEPNLAARAEARRMLEVDLRQAIKDQIFTLHFQPFYDAASGALRGFEALSRWAHPQRGVVPPGEFIPVAEETGLILPLGDWVIGHACEIAVGWPSELRVAINVSARQFSKVGLVDTVRATLARTGLAASRLELEITETVLLGEPQGVRQVLNELRALGVSIALDDFGTGYSSLGYLRHFPVERLKIDKGFVADIADDPKVAQIVQAMIALGHSLGMPITAEGVETEAQRVELCAAGCDELQGYFFSRPVPADMIPRLLRREAASLSL